MDNGGVVTAYQSEVARHAHALLSSTWKALEDTNAIHRQLVPGAPRWPTESDTSRTLWLDTLIATAATAYASPPARHTPILEALAERFSELVTVAAVSLAAPRGDMPTSDTIGRAHHEARGFLRAFPDTTFPLIAGDAFNPRAEYRDAITGAYAIATSHLKP